MTPKRLTLKRDEKLEVEWPDGRVSAYPVKLLRAKCPCASCKELREQMKKSRLTVISKPIEQNIAAEKAERVGNYAIKIHWNDGHDAGIYSWTYLREIEPP
ncbi:MAG: DUF971 domain-containing protein [Tepidisphaeraceae bacterium]